MINDEYINLLKSEYKQAFLQYKKSGISEGYGSHQPVLIHMLNTIKTGSVLEFGVGHHSTPVMNLICGMQNRKLLSIDFSVKWLNKFIAYKSSLHDMFVFDNEKLMNKEYDFFKERHSIAFIDGCPPADRQPLIMLLKDNVDYFVVHDTEQVADGIKNPVFNYNYDFTLFKHTLHFRQADPITSVVSDLLSIADDVLYIFK